MNLLCFIPKSNVSENQVWPVAKSRADVHNATGVKLLTVCFYHVTYAFQSESTLYSCLNVKELLARSRREI